ncbi:Hydrophobic seed protein domain - like 6 [Theobroma cacao]|nr:Hydrophobic seed protein domain - like 6 [Theobroma cacao]
MIKQIPMIQATWENLRRWIKPTHDSSDSNNSSNSEESAAVDKHNSPNSRNPVQNPGKSLICPVGVYLNVLNCLVDAKLGKPPKEPCCSLIEGLVDLEAALCLLHCHQSQCLGHCRPGRSGFFELDSQLLWKGGSFDFQCPA